MSAPLSPKLPFKYRRFIKDTNMKAPGFVVTQRMLPAWNASGEPLASRSSFRKHKPILTKGQRRIYRGPKESSFPALSWGVFLDVYVK